jgi:hypothetical protein
MADVAAIEDVREAAVQAKKAADRLDIAAERLEVSTLGSPSLALERPPMEPVDDDNRPPPDRPGPK